MTVSFVASFKIGSIKYLHYSIFTPVKTDTIFTLIVIVEALERIKQIC